MTVLYAAVLGVIQGLTEFLPVSSSAHLILARAFFGWDFDRLGLAFDVACHVGTLLAVLVFFRGELTGMALALPSIFRKPASPSSRMLVLIAVGTVPAVAFGLAAGKLIEETLRTPGVAAAALAAGAVLILAAERSGARARSEDTLTMIEALGLGCAQAAALVPGVSRSGATIAIGLFLGLRRDAAARFSFLLGVPAILAAAGKEGVALRGEVLTTEVFVLFGVGIVTSAVVGYLTVKYFLRFVAGHRLDVFAFYRLALAASVPVWLALS